MDTPFIPDPFGGNIVGIFSPLYDKISKWTIEKNAYAGADAMAAAGFQKQFDAWAIGFIGQAERMNSKDIPTVLAAYGRTPPVPPNGHVVTLNPDYSVTLSDGPPVVQQPAIPDPAQWYVDRDPQTLFPRLSRSHPATSEIPAGQSMLGQEVQLGVQQAQAANPMAAINSILVQLKALKAQGVDVASLLGLV